MKPALDQVDRQLLKLLQEDGRISNANLARTVGLSPPSVLQRVRKLEEMGLVANYTAILDREAMGYSLMVIAQVSLSLHNKKPIDAFVAAIGNIPEVLECLHVSGDYDFLLKIIVEDMHAYERFIREQLSTIDGVGKIHSCFVLASKKYTTELPLS